MVRAYPNLANHGGWGKEKATSDLGTSYRKDRKVERWAGGLRETTDDQRSSRRRDRNQEGTWERGGLSEADFQALLLAALPVEEGDALRVLPHAHHGVPEIGLPPLLDITHMESGESTGR